MRKSAYSLGLSLLLLLPGLFSFEVHAQEQNLSGFVEDAETGERLIGARIMILGSKMGALSNSEGFFSLKFQKETGAQLIVTYLGYLPDTILIDGLDADALIIAMQTGFSLETVNIVAPVSQVGKLRLTMEQIKSLPSLAGEVDAMRAFQLLPGVAGGNEGTAALYVRGGSPDQNLVLLDDVPLYYVNHVGGFLSIFDPNTINQMTLIKGGFPARYGGRLSSVLEVYTKSGNQQKLRGNFHLGMLSGGLTLEGPLMSEKTTFLLSARRSFVDAFTRVASQLSSTGNYSAGYTFYDLNGKITHRLSPSDLLSFSVYHGQDGLFAKGNNVEEEAGGAGKEYRYKSRTQLNWGNTTAALRWQHLFHDELNGKVILGYTRFHYLTQVTASKTDPANDSLISDFLRNFHSNVQDGFVKAHLDWYPDERHHLELGGTGTVHFFRPGSSAFRQTSEGGNLIDVTSGDASIPAVEGNIYVADTWRPTTTISVEAGLHASLFNVQGKTYPSLQPRLQLTWDPNQRLLFHGSFSQMQQALHLLSNSGGGLPTDLWVPATSAIPPQKAWQIVLGAAVQLDRDGSWHLSTENFYKEMSQLIDFRSGTDFFSGGNDWQEEVVQGGMGEVYGTEWLLEKRKGRFTGWIGYTLSWNWRRFDQIDNGERFPYTYDRRHDLSVVGNFDANERVKLSASWTYATGRAVTLTPGLVPSLNTDWRCGREECTPLFYGLQQGHLYPSRNNYRMPAYHRLDISVSFTEEIPDKPGAARTWRFGLYNAYWRQNPYFIFLEYDDSGAPKLFQFSLFPLLPSLSFERTF